jgi:hypothetical protein
VAPLVEREIAQQMRQGQVFVRGGHRALLLGERQGDGPDLSLARRTKTGNS